MFKRSTKMRLPPPKLRDRVVRYANQKYFAQRHRELSMHHDEFILK
jgi:hypothetical protein